MTSQDQVARLLAMVPYLRAHPGIGVAQAAAAFDVTKRQLLADLNVLWMCGLPGGLPDDLIEIDMDAATSEGVIHLSNADYLSRPMRFTPDEAVSLLVALRAVAEMTTGPSRAAARSAAEKLSDATGQQDLVWLSVSTGDDRIRELLTAAIERRQRVHLTYDGAARGTTSYPDVDPAGIQMRDSIAYLQAWSLERGDWRTYRIDRIVEVVTTGQPVDDHGPIPELPDGWFDQSDGEVTLELTAGATWVIDYYPARGVAAGPDGGASVRFAVADPAWLDSLLLRLGDQVRSVSPESASRAATAAAREAIERTELLFGGQVSSV